MDMNSILVWITKDFWVIVIMLLCLFACVYTVYSVGSYQEQINNAWEIQWEQSGCAAAYVTPEIMYRFVGGYNETEN